MAAEQSKPKGLDLGRGIPFGDVPDGSMLAGHVGDDAVLLVRRGKEFFAIGATCGGPLAEGLATGDTVRCPWHHACFICARARRSARRRGGWILTRARISGLNIGSLPNAKARLQRETSSDSRYDFPTSRSSGASITTCRSITSATPRNGTRSKSWATSRGAIASFAIAGTAGCWRLPRSFAISRTSRRKRRWSAVQPIPLKPGLYSSQ
jgi:hypothetical protein